MNNLYTLLDHGLVSENIETPEDLYHPQDVCWMTAYGVLVPVIQMVDDHLVRTIAMLILTDIVETREAYYEDGTVFAIWTRIQWAEYLLSEARERGLNVPT